MIRVSVVCCAKSRGPVRGRIAADFCAGRGIVSFRDLGGLRWLFSARRTKEGKELSHGHGDKPWISRLNTDESNRCWLSFHVPLCLSRDRSEERRVGKE